MSRSELFLRPIQLKSTRGRSSRDRSGGMECVAYRNHRRRSLGFSFSTNPIDPYRFSVRIPPHITPGKYALTAFGQYLNGTNLKSESLTIWVERPGQPLSIQVDPPFLDVEVGDGSSLRVLGTYADGSEVDLTRSRHTNFVSQSPEIARVSFDGFVDAVRVGVTNIVIDGKFLIPVTVRPARRSEKPARRSRR